MPAGGRHFECTLGVELSFDIFEVH
jgi:hypothetical protein